MADFRRWIPALAILVLVLGSVGQASAQNHSISCTAAASVIPDLRHEGLNELTGDILLSCIGAPGATPNVTGTVPQTNVTVNLSAPWTSRVFTTSSGSTGVSESLLLVDDPGPANQNVCAYPFNGLQCQQAAFGGTSYGLEPGALNVFQGIVTPGQPNLITFLGVPVDPPATTLAARTYRITNIRVNASTVAAGAFGLSPVYGFVSSSSSTSMEIAQPQQTIGLVTNGLTVSESSKGYTTTFLQCTSPSAAVGSITFTEDFATAFKVAGNGVTYTTTKPITFISSQQNTPGVVYNSESGLEINTTWGVTGISDTGTRLQAVFSNIPLGVSLFVDDWAKSPASTTGCPGAGCSDGTLVTGSGTPTDPYTNTVTKIANGTVTSATAVWEVTNTNPGAIDSLTFVVYASFTGTPGTPGSPIANQEVGVIGSFNPLVATWADGPVPEFSTTVNVPTTPYNLFEIVQCQTILLFPYVTDFYGFDTGIAISNTSMDPLPTGIGASPQSGACNVTFYGAAGGGIATTLGTSGVYSSTSDTSLTNGLVPAGGTWAFSLSSIDPGYNSTPTYGTTGYAIAVCNFQYAHGYSFVSDTGIRQFAAAYLALIIPDVPRSPVPFSANGGANTGEQLVH